MQNEPIYYAKNKKGESEVKALIVTNKRTSGRGNRYRKKKHEHVTLEHIFEIRKQPEKGKFQGGFSVPLKRNYIKGKIYLKLLLLTPSRRF